MEKHWYAYLWIISGIARYAGKGQGERYWQHYLKGKNAFANFLRKSDGEGKWIECQMFYFDTEQEAFDKEKELIAEYGTQWKVEGVKKGTLFNRTSGGEGQSGRIQYEEEKIKRANSNRGKKRTDEFRKRLSEIRTGINQGPPTEEHRGKISAALLGIKRSEETKLKLSQSKKSYYLRRRFSLAGGI